MKIERYEQMALPFVFNFSLLADAVVDVTGDASVPMKSAALKLLEVPSNSYPSRFAVNPDDWPEVPMGPRTMDLKGRRFGRLEVVRLAVAGGLGRGAKWLAECGCGNFVVVRANGLRRGLTQSCGCYSADACKAKIHRGKESDDPRSTVWGGLIRKADLVTAGKLESSYNRTDAVCPRWRIQKDFLADVGERPSAQHQYRRLDKKKPHGPGNWEWLEREGKATNQQKGRRLIEHDGRVMTLIEWSRETGSHKDTIVWRLKNGWSPERALTTPPLVNCKAAPKKETTK